MASGASQRGLSPLAGEPTAPALPPLYGEHLALGAVFGDGTVPLRYPGEGSAPTGPGAFLCDITHAQLLLFSGAPAPAFATTAFAGRELRVGECAFEAALTGDGAVASVPLLARTGDSEYVALDLSPRADVLSAWLSFLSSVSQDGVAPFAGMQTEDVTGSHVALLLWGPAATGILSDYLGEQRPPAPGEVASLLLDRIPCIVAAPKAGSDPCYLLLVPPARARALWRSLLSFSEVEPVGTEALIRWAQVALPWSPRLRTADTLRICAPDLLDFGLVRAEGTFVGARGLANTPKE